MYHPLLQHVYVINMDKDTQRLSTISENLARYNVTFTRIPAINGKDLSSNELVQKTTYACRNYLCTKGVIGSGLSHMKTWETIASSRTSLDTWHLVLEDDIEFTDATLQQLDKLHQHLATNNITYGIININCHNPYEIGCSIPHTSLLGKNAFAFGASAYLITPQTARDLLTDLQNRVPGYIDAYMSTKHGSPPYYVTRERYVVHDFDMYKSANMQANLPPIALFLLSNIGLDEVAFFFNVPIINIGMVTQINIMSVLFLALLTLNVMVFRNIWIYVYIVLELVAYTLLKVVQHRKKKA